MWPFNKDTEIYKYHKNYNLLYYDYQKLKKENEMLNKHFHTLTGYKLDDFLQLNECLESELSRMGLPHIRSTPDETRAHVTYSLYAENEKLKEEITRLSKDNIKTQETLKRYEQDEKEMYCENNNLKCILREKIEYIKRLEKELQMYKNFFEGNQVHVILKDSEQK